MRQPVVRTLLAFLVATGLASAAGAQAPAPSPAVAPGKADTKADPRAGIIKKFGDIKLEDVRISPVGGVYEVTRGSDVVLEPNPTWYGAKPHFKKITVRAI